MDRIVENKELKAEIVRLRAKCVRLEDHINNADDESIRLRADNERLTMAIKWALGEEGDFGQNKPENAPPFWWRRELRKHAALAADGKGE